MLPELPPNRSKMVVKMVRKSGNMDVFNDQNLQEKTEQSQVTYKGLWMGSIESGKPTNKQCSIACCLSVHLIMWRKRPLQVNFNLVDMENDS